MNVINVPAIAPIVNGTRGKIELKHKSNLQNFEIPAVIMNKNTIDQIFAFSIRELNLFISLPTTIRNVAKGTDDKVHGNWTL